MDTNTNVTDIVCWVWVEEEDSLNKRGATFNRQGSVEIEICVGQLVVYLVTVLCIICGEFMCKIRNMLCCVADLNYY
jgi:hypothetical protein